MSAPDAQERPDKGAPGKLAAKLATDTPDGTPSALTVDPYGVALLDAELGEILSAWGGEDR